MFAIYTSNQPLCLPFTTLSRQITIIRRWFYVICLLVSVASGCPVLSQPDSWYSSDRGPNPLTRNPINGGVEPILQWVLETGDHDRTGCFPSCRMTGFMIFARSRIPSMYGHIWCFDPVTPSVQGQQAHRIRLQRLLVEVDTYLPKLSATIARRRPGS